jgi:acetyl-CoA carboxylase biotin carboxylase subunit
MSMRSIPAMGLLSENANFAEVCRASNIKFIGPPPEVTRHDGREVHGAADDEEGEGADSAGVGWRDRGRRRGAGVGEDGWLSGDPEGCGGRRRARDAHRAATKRSCRRCFKQASTEAANAFGNGDMYMEKFIERPRHIEFQVLADEHGNVMSLGERECSIQRRHQKLIEEAPSLQVTPKLREEIGQDDQEVAEGDRLLERRDDRVPDG